MSDLFDQPESGEPAKSAVQQLFVDEAGDPTLFHSSGKPSWTRPVARGFYARQGIVCHTITSLD